MNVSELKPTPTKRQVFSAATAKHVPALPGCYVLTTFQDEILYIGLAQSLSARIKQHLDNPEKVRPGAVGRAHWFWYMECKGINLINRLERGWLNQHELSAGSLPALNSIRSPVS